MVELPDPIWTVDGSYDIFTGGRRPGGVLNLLWEKVHAEVEESNRRALLEGLHLLQLPSSPEGMVSCTRCGTRKSWQHFHTLAKRLVEQVDGPPDDDEGLLRAR